MKLERRFLQKLIREEVQRFLNETWYEDVNVSDEIGPMRVSAEIDPTTQDVLIHFGNAFTISHMSSDDLMKLSQLFRRASEASEIWMSESCCQREGEGCFDTDETDQVDLNQNWDQDKMNEEAAKCYENYKAGNLTWDEYQECLRRASGVSDYRRHYEVDSHRTRRRYY